MRESTVISGWIAEGQAKGRLETQRADLLRALRVRFRSEVYEDLSAAIRDLSNGEELARWFDAALTAGSMDEFRAAVQR